MLSVTCVRWYYGWFLFCVFIYFLACILLHQNKWINSFVKMNLKIIVAGRHLWAACRLCMTEASSLIKHCYVGLHYLCPRRTFLVPDWIPGFLLLSCHRPGFYLLSKAAIPLVDPWDSVPHLHPPRLERTPKFSTLDSSFKNVLLLFTNWKN